MATNAKKTEDGAKVVSAEEVPVTDGGIQSEEPAKANSGETAGRVNPKLDTLVVTVGEDHYSADQMYNLKNSLYDLKDADGVHYFVKDNN